MTYYYTGFPGKKQAGAENGNTERNFAAKFYGRERNRAKSTAGRVPFPAKRGTMGKTSAARGRRREAAMEQTNAGATGALIAQRRREKGRSLPGIDCLEPLAEALDLQVLELLRGRRLPPEAPAGELAEVQEVLAYSRREVRRRTSTQRRRYLAALLALLLAAGLGLWRSGLLSLRDRCPSPAGDAVIRIYDGTPGSLSSALSLQLWEKGDWSPSVQVSYPAGEYQGLWWAPDGEKYLLAFRQGGEPRLDLCLREQSVCRDLTACLAGFPAEGTEYQFLQWSEDGGALLLHYREAAGQSGYFWYDIASGEVSGVWEMGENG